MHPKLQETLPGPLPLLVEAATSLLSLAKACMLQMPRDHFPVAPSDSQRSWFSLSQLKLGLPASPQGREAGSCLLCPCTCGVLTWCCLSVFVRWWRGSGRKGVRCPASPSLLTAHNCSCGSYSYHPVPALQLFSTSWLIGEGTNR